jgi:FkbH-like protein
MGVRPTSRDVVADHSRDQAVPDLAALSERLDWQSVLFGTNPERGALLRLTAPWPLSTRRIRFHRNHAIEPALSVLRPFLEYAGIEPDFLVSEYDDALSFTTKGFADVEVIWLDFTRLTAQLSPREIGTWLGSRVGTLRARTNAPILILDWDGPTTAASEFAEHLRRAVASLGRVRLAKRQDLGARYFDDSRVAITGTRMSAQGAICTARLLGSRWLPALLEPRLKAVVVDLDNTLYEGVLGEDGIDGVCLTAAHAELQHELLSLSESGVFLAAVSRNEPADVHSLFRRRDDFLIGWEDFSVCRIGWRAKSEGLEDIADELRIDTGAMLFVDDNAGELLEALQRLPRLRCLHAGRDAVRTVSALRYFPGLWAFETTSEDKLRVADARANQERDRELDGAPDVASYYRELGVGLALGHDPITHLARAAELSGKTNQFNLALRRYQETGLQALLAGDRWELSVVRLQDRLADSGVIAMAVCERRGGELRVEELCISCRALGRQLENLIVAQMLVSQPIFEGADVVVFSFMDGPRNGLARTWLGDFTGRSVPPAAERIGIPVTARRIVEAAINPHVGIEAFG